MEEVEHAWGAVLEFVVEEVEHTGGAVLEFVRGVRFLNGGEDLVQS